MVANATVMLSKRSNMMAVVIDVAVGVRIARAVARVVVIVRRAWRVVALVSVIAVLIALVVVT